jgi:methionine sulfoxide reductase heme-binding subunit
VVDGSNAGMRSVFNKLPPFQITVHLVSWLLFAWLIFDFFTGNLSVNPIQEITQRTGRYAIWLLIASLACTPLNTLFGLRQVLTIRRALGLYAFMFASLHFLTFSGLDYQFNWSLLKFEILEKRYIIVGSIVFTILLALAVTSTRGWQKRLGKKWRSLHRLVYAAGLLVILHYAWAKKGDIFSLQGDILMPLVAGIIVVILLLLRLPVIRRWVTSFRSRVRRLVRTSLKPT